MSVPLYEISEEIKQLESMETEGDQSLEEAIANSLDDLNLDFNEKIDNIVKLNQSMDGDVVLIDAEIKRLQERKQGFKKRQDSLKQYVLNNMKALDKKNIKTALFSVTSMAGRDKIFIDDESKIPSDFINIKVTETPDKKALLKAMKDGQVAGCHLEKSENTLRIK
ncbi:MAG: siphovirus Gp157 family protein [Desulfobacteraceae bacterium]|nr:siphovirus Gp157 family protein [Desulfobacteraceae bacterium]